MPNRDEIMTSRRAKIVEAADEAAGEGPCWAPGEHSRRETGKSTATPWLNHMLHRQIDGNQAGDTKALGSK